MITVSPDYLTWLLIGTAAALMAFYAYVLGREGRQDRRLSGGQILLLWMLRIGIASLALIALARPAYERVEREERPPVVSILVDESLSMDFPSSRDNPLAERSAGKLPPRYQVAQVATQKLTEKLSPTHRVQIYTFSDALRLLRAQAQGDSPTNDDLTAARNNLFAEHPSPTGGYSNIGDAISSALGELSGEKVSGVVVLSDGRQTGGRQLSEAAEQASAANVPVHAVTFGSEFPLRDLRIDEVIAPAEASLDDVLTFHVKVNNQISSALATRLTLSVKDAETETAEYAQIASRSVTLTRGEQMVTISTIPTKEGLMRYRLSLPHEEDEINLDNNSDELTVRIVKRTLKVLLIAGQPSREYLYMAPALLRDPIIDLSCYLQSADVDYTQQGNTVIQRLPATVKEWSRYDVAILFDVDPNGITTQQLAGLENMVSNGGGLMIIAGRSHGLAKLVQVHAARIRGLLPVEVNKNVHPNHDHVYSVPFHAVRTTQGRMHPVLLASADTDLNDRVWTSFEHLDFYWHHPVEGAKPKSIVLLERVGGSAGQDKTLMAIHRYVDGAVFFSAVDSLWRWRYPYESFDYDRLWTRVIRYLGEARLMGTQQQVSLATDRRSYAPGEDVQISLRVLDPALHAQLADQPIFAGIAPEAGDAYMVPLRPDAQNPGTWLGMYRARQLGTLAVRCRQIAPDADSEAKPLFDVSHSFQVKMQSLEDVDTSADLEGMRQLAAMTGGKYFDYRNMADVETLAEMIPTDPLVLTETTVEEVWDGSAFLALFLVLICSELVLRKWWGLL